MSTDIPKFLHDALADKKVVVFVGAGVSMSIEKHDGTPLFPSWKGFVDILATASEDNGQPDVALYLRAAMRLKKPPYLEAIEQAKEALGDDLWYHYIKNAFDPDEHLVDENSLKLSKLIWDLAGNLIITTNVDSSLRWACPSRNYMPLDGQRVELADFLNNDFPRRPAIWYLHGHVDNAEHIIFTKKQFEAFYKEGKNEAKLQSLLTFLARRTFLFIGFSLDDEYFRQQLENVHNIYGGRGSYYVLLHRKYEDKASLPKFVRDHYFDDYGKPLEDLIEKMAIIVKSKGLERTKNIGETDEERVRKGLPGRYEYACKIDGDENTFDGPNVDHGDVERGGIMDIELVIEKEVISFKIYGKRLWSKAKGQEKGTPLKEPWQWHSKGEELKLRVRQFTFEYESELKYVSLDAETIGTTIDTYRLNPDFSLMGGTFIHHMEKGGGMGYEVMGTVKVTKMTDKTFEYAPEGTVYPENTK